MPACVYNEARGQCRWIFSSLTQRFIFLSLSLSLNLEGNDLANLAGQKVSPNQLLYMWSASDQNPDL